MTRRATILLAALIALYGAPAAAQMACGTHASMIASLDLKFGETRRGFGLSGPKLIFEVWASDETGTWTILQVYPSGTACLMASGKYWQTAPPVAPGEPL